MTSEAKTALINGGAVWKAQHSGVVARNYAAVKRDDYLTDGAWSRWPSSDIGAVIASLLGRGTDWVNAQRLEASGGIFL